ncbi:MAG: S41 family peptidase [Candidatus Wallbacteria bacterium]|nr:S41 family peptidase [Candidatus Wallbacteria bacterium]
MKKLLIIALSFCILSVHSATIPTSQDDVELLKEAILIIKSSYVKANLNDRELIHGAINGIVETLNDPYTNFLSSDEFKDLNDETSGQFGGVGIIVTLREQKVTVISPIFGSPADQAGIRAGDLITEVNGQPIKDGELKKALQLLKGEIGETVEIETFTPSDNKYRKSLLNREVVKNTSIIFSGVTPDNFGYVRIRNFSASTADDLEKEIKDMESVPIKGLILDLRSNAGGLLTAGINVADLFLESGTILSTRSRDGEKNVYMADAQISHKGYPMVVLIDRGSASAAEIVAAALHDNQKAILVGEKSFGKGCVQTVKTLSDGSALSLTTAWYYTPAGECIHDKGINPDVLVENPVFEDQKKVDEIVNTLRKEQEQSYQDRYQNKIHRFTPFEYDNQLLRAVDTLREFWKFQPLYEKFTPAVH